jgi:hypothetical protein
MFTPSVSLSPALLDTAAVVVSIVAGGLCVALVARLRARQAARRRARSELARRSLVWIAPVRETPAGQWAGFRRGERAGHNPLAMPDDA